MTTRIDEKVKELNDIAEQFSDEVIERIEEQGRKVAANMLLELGDKALVSASGVVYAIARAHLLALVWAKREGLIELSDSVLATEDELAERRDLREKRKASGVSAALGGPGDVAGQYL